LEYGQGETTITTPKALSAKDRTFQRVLYVPGGIAFVRARAELEREEAMEKSSNSFGLAKQWIQSFIGTTAAKRSARRKKDPTVRIGNH
jgi:hypothetical protein